MPNGGEAIRPEEMGTYRKSDIAWLEASHSDLLETLKCMLVGACACAVPHAGERAVLQEATDRARAAIAKAER